MSLAASSPAAGGDLLWVSHYGGPANDYDQPDSVMVSPDGSRVFVTGTSASTVTDYDYATAAYDSATGRALWGVRYQGPGHSYDTAYGLAVSADGASVFVTGASIGVSSNYDYATVAYDAKTGAERWVRRYNGAGNGFDLALSVAVSPDSSRVFVTGESTRAAASNDDWATLAYDARTGAHLWTKRFGADNGDDEAYALVVSPDGSKVFVTGLGYPGAGDLGTVAYEASSGHLLWKNRYNGIGGAIDVGYAIAVSPDGSKVFAVGSSYSNATAQDFTTVAYQV
jgi:WD40 repeat protein